MRIAHVTSELAPYSQTGGLAQVAFALPDALVGLGGGEHQVSVFTPLYRGAQQVLAERGQTLSQPHGDVSVEFAGHRNDASFRTLVLPDGLHIHFLDCPKLFDRDGIYGDQAGEFADNAERFATLCRATLDASSYIMGGPPDIFHCHDWPTGLLPILLRSQLRDFLPDARCVFTIHNLAYQGCFPKQLINDLHLPWSAFTLHGMEFYDQVSTLKAGIAFADATTTVSVSYADEIRTPEFGHYLDGFLRSDCPRLLGIRNGIDTVEWDPATDPHIEKTYTSESLDGKDECRTALLAEYGLEANPGELVIGMVSRLAGQKGLDLVADIVPELQRLGGRLILVGNGETPLEDRFRWLANNFREHLAVHIGFDPARAHRVFAGSDAFLMPSRFEPCGLGQMVAMRYGGLPIAHAVGGLRDTVEDPGDTAIGLRTGNGFRFEEASSAALFHALERAARMHREDAKTWQQLMLRGMRADWSWAQSAQQYLQLYRELRSQ